MILLLLLLGPVLGAAVFVYGRAWVKGVKSVPALFFDAAVFFLGAALCWRAYRHFYEAMQGTPDSGWWPLMTLMSCLVIYPAVLFWGAFLRKRLFR